MEKGFYATCKGVTLKDDAVLHHRESQEHGQTNEGRIVHIAENTVPHSLETVSANMPVSAVLELRGGRVAELKIAPGDKLRHAYFSPLRRRSGGS